MGKKRRRLDRERKAGVVLAEPDRAPEGTDASPPEPRTKTSWRIYVALAVILAAGAFLRVAYLSDLRQDPLYAHPLLDAELHDYWAHAIATGDWTVPRGRHDPHIRSTPYFRPPGYPYVLAAFDVVTRSDPAGIRYLQFGVGLLTAVFGFLLGRRLAGPLAGLAAASGIAMSWPMIFLEGELLDSAVLAAVVLAALLLLDDAASRPTLLRGAVAGLIVGAAAIVRPNVLAFAPVAVVWVGWAGSRRASARPARLAALAVAAGVVLAILPATLRNVRVTGQWVLISANGGINLLVGNNPQADGLHATIPGVEKLADRSGWTCFDYPALVSGLSRSLGRPLDYAEASRVWAAAAWKWIAANPGRFAALTAKRTALFLGPAEVGDRDIDLSREASPVLRRIPGRFPWVLGLALVGFALLALPGKDGAAHLPADRRRSELAILIAGFVISYTASFVVFFFNSRYRIPVLAALYPPAGAGIALIVSRIRERRMRAALLAAVAAVAVAAVLSIDVVGVPHPPGAWHFQRGTAYWNAGDLPHAIAEYEETIRTDPRNTLARTDLGIILRSQGRVTEALAQWNTALQADPKAVEPRFNLAQTLAAQGKFSESIAAFRELLAVAPNHARAHLSLGSALAADGQPEEGWAEYEKARAIAPDDPLIAYVMGRFLLSRDRRDEGIAELERALRLDPGNRAATDALAAARSGVAPPTGYAR